ncbi:MAG: hypothetical protein J0I98_05040 [Mesorhizobium sp.]|nr:hypothetical protein [Mesorhizobium sp.]MBN9242139.1 hypothetical protein [Mesorhizobium sp.]
MRFYSVLSAAVCAACTIGVSQAWANLTYTPFTTDQGLHVLVVSGEFTPDDQIQQFAAAVAANSSTVVTFDSGGGTVTTAMALGRMIRLLGLNTMQVRQLECASACSLAFLGGVSRIAAPGSIGVHRTSFAPDSTVGRDEAVASVQELTAEVISYLSEMGVNAELLNFALRYDRSDIRYLSASEMADLKVTTSQMAVAELPSSQPEQASTGTSGGQSIEAAALGIVRSLIERDGNDPAAAIQAVATFYADNVSYYGKSKSLSEVLEDKRKYFTRWPERAYRIRNDSVMVTCANGACMVSGVYDWLVRSIPRNKQAQGVARFSYTISLGADPKIISEAGNVVK